MAGNLAQVENRSWSNGMFVVFAQDHVFGDGEVFDHAITHTFFGDVGKHAVGDFTGGEIGNILPFEDGLCPMSLCANL
jgi:hypothetical protein